MTNEDLTQKNEISKVYEVGYLLLPILDEDGVLKEVSKIKDIIDKNKGMFLSEGIPQVKTLTYPMTKTISSKNQKFDTAHFGWIKFEMDSDNINSIKEELDKLENLLRFLLIKTVKESVAVNKGKVGKFSFDKEKTTKDEKVEDKEDKKEEKVSKKDDKELDETIDELVIE